MASLVSPSSSRGRCDGRGRCAGRRQRRATECAGPTVHAGARHLRRPQGRMGRRQGRAALGRRRERLGLRRELLRRPARGRREPDERGRAIRARRQQRELRLAGDGRLRAQHHVYAGRLDGPGRRRVHGGERELRHRHLRDRRASRQLRPVHVHADAGGRPRGRGRQRDLQVQRRFGRSGLHHEPDEAGISGHDRKIWTLGAGYALGGGTLKAQYTSADAYDDQPNTGAKQIAVGYDYPIAKNGTVYVVYAKMDNDDAASFTPANWGHGKSAGVAAPGESPYGIGVGFIYDLGATWR